MDDLDNIPAGMPLLKGQPIVIRGGHAYLATDGETPVAVCTVDCTTNAVGVLEPVKE